jgi:type III secretory pathway component EscS
MRKIHVLKSIIDFIWIVTAPIGIPLILICVPALFFYDFTDLNIKIQGINLATEGLYSKILIAFSLSNYLLLIYSLYLFRKSLRYFLNAKIFDIYIILSFRKIGNAIVLYGIVSLIISIVGQIHFKQEISLEFGLKTHLTLICLGLFFMVLSEVFKIAKTAKQENDLTI